MYNSGPRTYTDIYRIATTWMQGPGLCRTCYDKRLARGDSTTRGHALSQRRLARVVYPTFRNNTSTTANACLRPRHAIEEILMMAQTSRGAHRLRYHRRPEGWINVFIGASQLTRRLKCPTASPDTSRIHIAVSRRSSSSRPFPPTPAAVYGEGSNARMIGTTSRGGPTGRSLPGAQTRRRSSLADSTRSLGLLRLRSAWVCATAVRGSGFREHSVWVVTTVLSQARRHTGLWHVWSPSVALPRILSTLASSHTVPRGFE